MKHMAIIAVFALSACATSHQAQEKSKAASASTKPDAAKALAVESIDLKSLDRSVNPCDDFYQFACGGWIKSHQIPADKSRWGRFDELQEKNLKKLRDILQAAAAGKADPKDKYGKKLGDFYAACMDEAGIEKTGLDDLKKKWAELDAISDLDSFAKEIGVLHSQGVNVIFNLFSMQDYKDSSKVIASIFQGGLSLPDRDYYLKDDAKSEEIRKNYLEHMGKMLTMAGVDKDRASKDAMAIFDLEKSMAETYWKRAEMRNPERIYNPMALAGLEKLAGTFNWKKYFGALGKPELASFSISTPKSLQRIGELLKKVPLDTWKAYLRWQVLDAMANNRALPKAFVDEDFSFQSKNFTGAKEIQPRWKHCTHLSDQLLGEALGQDFVRKWFGGNAKEDALKLIHNIQAAQGANLAGLSWMDDATREKAIEKLKKIDNKIGYPSKWRDYTSVKIDRSSFLNSLLAAMAHEVKRDLDKIGKPVDRTEWAMTPQTVNAYYNPQLNEMVFPAGILQPMFYTPGANDSVNYGAIGFVMGHELTHGFDDEGRKFDAMGNMKDWWSPDVAKEFVKRASCVEKQFSGYVAVADVHVNGKLTLGENIADLGGLKLSMAAYRAAHKGQKPEATIGGFTPEQQFFLAAAHVWCSKIRPEEARRRVMLDPHSPPKWRVNGPLSNLPDFAEAFQCKPGDAMVRKERCELW